VSVSKSWVNGVIARLSGVRMQLAHYRRYGRLVIGASIVLAVLTAASFSEWLAPRDPNRVNLIVRLTPPFWEEPGDVSYLLGTDQLGRDVLSRIIYGSRVSVMVGIFSVMVGGTLGTLLGLISGYFGGRLDNFIMRLTDIQLSMPFMLMALLVVVLLGPSLANIVVVFTITAWHIYARLARASTLSIRENQDIEAARALGASDFRILRSHVLPSLVSPLVVIASFEMARIITTEAALGFLGLGVPPPQASWGSMLSDGREYMQDAWWIATLPGLALMITVLGINLVGDSLRDLFDPKLQV